MRPKSLPRCPRPVGPRPWQPPSGPVVSWSPCPSDLSPLPPFQEKNLGPSRRSPGTPRPPGVSKGGRIPPQHGGRAGMGRTSRSWEDSPGEQPRGGAGGRSRRGRGRGSPHLSGGGDASTADRKSKVGAEGADVCLTSIGKAQCCLLLFLFCSQMDFLLHPSFTVSVFFFGPSLRLFFISFPFFFSPPDQLCGPCLFLSPILCSAVCLVICLPYPLSLFGGIWWVLSSVRALLIHVCVHIALSLSFPELVGRER